MARRKGHSWFAGVYSWQTEHEPAAIRRLRDSTLAGLSGRVLEIGCGNGPNFTRYPPSVIEVVAIDPDPHMVRRSHKRAEQAGRAIRVEQVGAEELPFEDDSFDAALAIWVFCTVPKPGAALAEIRRVLKPGGELHFLEHVRYQSGPLALIQDRILPVWRWIGAGCNPNRDTEGSIEAAGFQMRELRRIKPLPPIPPTLFVRPNIQGVAIAP